MFHWWVGRPSEDDHPQRRQSLWRMIAFGTWSYLRHRIPLHTANETAGNPADILAQGGIHLSVINGVYFIDRVIAGADLTPGPSPPRRGESDRFLPRRRSVRLVPPLVGEGGRRPGEVRSRDDPINT